MNGNTEKLIKMSKTFRELADEIDKSVELLEGEDIANNEEEIENIESKIVVKFIKIQKLLS